MAESFDWSSIQLPEGIDYDQLYDELLADPQMLERLVKEVLEKDDNWLLLEKRLKEMREKQIKDNIRQMQENDQKFDQLIEDMHKSIINAKTTTITDTIYFDDEFTYYSEPIQRVIDVDELRERMGKLDVCQPSTSGCTARVKREDSIDSNKPSEGTQTEDDDIMELSVVEAPNKGPQRRSYQPFQRKHPSVGDRVYAASNAILTHCWKPGKIIKNLNYWHSSVAFDDRSIVGGNILLRQLIAYYKSNNDPIAIGERVIAYLDESTHNMLRRELYSGTVAEPARNTNDYRYLIFFDKHAYRYVKREDIFYIYEKISVDKIFGDTSDQLIDPDRIDYVEFLKNYFKNYPERPMLRLQVGDDRIKVRYHQKWESAKVLKVDSSLALLNFEKLEKPHSEWIYRGSRRLYDICKEYQTTKSNVKHRALRSTTRKVRTQGNSYVEWNTAEDESSRDKTESQSDDEIKFVPLEEANRKRKLKQTARKSTAKPSMASASVNAINMISSLLGDPIEINVEQLPDLSLIEIKELIPNHLCSNDCINVEAESKNFYDQNPFYIPIIVGYRRELIRTNERKIRIVYRTPCGRRLRNIFEVWNYLRITDSQIDIDVFTFSSGFALFRNSNPLKAFFHVEDITNGTERQPISCVNTIDSTDLGPVIYKAERFPHPDVTFAPNPDFLSCCDCTDNCSNPENCSCQQLTLEASDAVRLSKHQVFGYEYKRLNDFVMTGVFECNQKCPCNQRCANRVVQNGIKCRLQLFKTLKKGWGVRVLHDVPKGTFLCIYAAMILNEDAADKEGKTFGDEYLADLDYIDVCETQKEGYESDVELSDDDYKESDEDIDEDDDDNDDEFKCSISGSSKKGRSTTSSIDSDRGSRDRRRFETNSRKSYSIREDFFGEDFCYSLDAKKMGNIGRYLNHSCEPNCFVQNVFVDTHDLRFPWVSFFAKKDIAAYEELSWDYNYEIGCIDNRKMLCYCGAHRCRKRLL